MEFRCNKCKLPKTKVKSGSRKEGNRTRYLYRDDKNRIWHGNTCPDCNYRTNKQDYKLDKIIFRQVKKHYCIKCEGELEYNWYWHFDCMPNIDHDIAQYGCLNEAWDAERK